MSRSGYSDDHEQWHLICWRGAVASAIRGARGQAFLKEMLLALEALPEKKLIAEELEANGAVCAIGAVGRARGIDMSKLCPDDRGSVARVFGLAPAMVAEIVYENDERTEWRPVEETPEARYARMLTWVKVQIKV